MFSYIVVDIAEDVSMCLGFGPDLTGLTVLAMSTSLPDCMGSVIVARMGKIDMVGALSGLACICECARVLCHENKLT